MESKSWKKKVGKKWKKKQRKKNFFKKVPGMLWGCFWGYQGTNKIYIEVVTTKKNENFKNEF